MRPSPCHLMLVHPDQAAAVTDALWARLRQEAEEAYEREPKLASLFFDSILNQPSFEAAVFHRVAARLKNDTISLPLIVQAFSKAAEDDGCLVEAAKADIAAVLDRDPACNRLIEPFLYFKGFHAIQAHRLNHWLWHQWREGFRAVPAKPLLRGVPDRHPSGGEVRAAASSWITPPAWWSAKRRRSAMTSPCCTTSPWAAAARNPATGTENPQRRGDRRRRGDPRQHRGRRACPCRRRFGGAEAGAGACDGGRRAGQGGADRAETDEPSRSMDQTLSDLAYQSFNYTI